MSHADELCPLGDVCCDVIAARLCRFACRRTYQTAVVRNRQMPHHNPPFHRLQLPADDVRVVLHLRHDHLIASLHLTLAERLSHEVDSFRRTTGKDNLLYLPGIDKLPHFLTGCLMQVCCLLRQIMHPPMHIGIHIEVFIPHGIEHTQRLLRRSRVVKVHQRLTIHLACQNGKIFSYLMDIVHIIYTVYILRTC